MKSINIFYLLYIFLIHNVYSIKLNSITPSEIEKSFSSEIEEHNVNISITIDNKTKDNTTKDIMIYIGYIQEHNRLLPPSSYNYCKNRYNVISRDWLLQESFYYSCCTKPLSCNNNTCIYSCPVPPADINPDPFRTFIVDINNVYIREVDKDSEWQKTDKEFIYIVPFTMEGFIRKSIILIFIISIILFTINNLMSAINFSANRYPVVTTIVHLILTILIICFESIILSTVKANDSYSKTIESALSFSILTSIYSLFLIYIPNKKDNINPSEKEQRIKISNKSCISKYIKFLKNNQSKTFFSIIFFGLICYQTWTNYIFMIIFREVFDAEWEILIVVIICKSILSIFFLVAFFTAIYEVKIPIHFDKNTGKMCHFFPENNRTQKLLNSVIPQDGNTTNNYLAGLCKMNEIVYFNDNDLLENELYTIDCDISNNNNPYSYLFWKIGKIKSNKLIIEKEILILEKTRGIINKKYGEIKLFNREKHNILRVYQTVKTSDNKYKFIDFGIIKNGYLHKTRNILIQMIASIFRILPNYSEDYEYNIIENLRNESHKLTRCMGKNYGILYWIIFSITTLGIIINESLYFRNIFNFVLVLVMMIFAIIVNTKITYLPKLRRDNHFRLLKLAQNKKKRGTVNLNKYKIDYSWLIKQNASIYNNYNNMNISEHEGLKWIILKHNVLDEFYFEFKVEKDCQLFGLGISNGINEDIFSMFKPGIWCSTKDNKVGINTLTDMKWITDFESRSFTVGCGYIHNRLFFVTPGKKIYCSDITIGNLVACVPQNVQVEIISYNINLKKENEFTYLPDINFDYNKNIDIEITDQVIINTTALENNWNNEIKLSQLSLESIKSHIIEQNKIGIEEMCYGIGREGLSVISYNKFIINEDPKELCIDIDITNCQNPEFIAFGLVEEKSLYSQSYINLIPGSKGFDSFGYHSDNGSICISNKEEDVEYTDNNLSWFNKNTLDNIFRIKLGFDGSSLYFVNPKGIRFTIDQINEIDLWKKENSFIPVLYFHGNNMKGIKLIFHMH